MSESLPPASAPHLSVVIPVHRPGGALTELYERLRATLEAQVTPNFELILVDDCSPDDAWDDIRRLVERDPRVRGFRFSRNFGQHLAITAGLEQARGEWTVIMDCDLQDVPEEIPKLYRKALEGCEIVLAQRVERQDTFFKKLNSRLFYWVFGYLTDTKPDPTTAVYGVYSRKVIDTLLGMRERMRFLPALLSWTGYPIQAVPVQHAEREYGQSSYSFVRLLRMAFDTIIAFSDKPLRLAVRLGFMISGLSVLLAVAVIIHHFVFSNQNTPLGWSSLMIAMSFFSGLIISTTGINALYIARVFDEVKRRPLYIINQACENQ